MEYNAGRHKNTDYKAKMPRITGIYNAVTRDAGLNKIFRG